MVRSWRAVTVRAGCFVQILVFPVFGALPRGLQRNAVFRDLVDLHILQYTVTISGGT